MSAMVSMRRSIPPSSIRDLDIERRVARRVRRQRRVVSPQIPSYPRLSNGVLWIERLARSQHTPDQVQELAHQGAQDELGWLAARSQALGEGLEHRVVALGHQRRHIELGPQGGIADA